jgi:hypothetical protein
MLHKAGEFDSRRDRSSGEGSNMRRVIATPASPSPNTLNRFQPATVPVNVVRNPGD